MRISGSVALVTGANRGLGQVFTRELIRRGAGKVYGAARNPAAGQVEVLADERSRFVKESLPRDPELIYPPIEEFWDAAVGGTG
jgi:NAD(P)-dependent dehydrogenase (short-subunit alcohol dehydrogenase family)